VTTIALLVTIGFCAGYAARPWILRAWTRIQAARYTKRDGACFRYDPRAERETIEGINSRYCKRCGKAAYEHYWTVARR